MLRSRGVTGKPPNGAAGRRAVDSVDERKGQNAVLRR